MKKYTGAEAEAVRQFREAYPGYKVTHTHYDMIDSKWWVSGKKIEGKILATQRAAYHV